MDNLLCLEPAQRKTCYSNSGEKNVNRISICDQTAHVQFPGQSQTNNKDRLHWSKSFSVYNVLSCMWPCLVNRWPLWWTGKVLFLTIIFILFGIVVHVIHSKECMKYTVYRKGTRPTLRPTPMMEYSRALGALPNSPSLLLRPSPPQHLWAQSKSTHTTPHTICWNIYKL